jgi:alkylation response protein AidB-like acyl-CoA dehydrogenase
VSDDVERARAIAEDVLFPAALDTDLADTLPAANLDALAAGGFFAPFVPSALGGLGLEGSQFHAVAEAFASGCLATTFVWIQHLGLLGSALGRAGDEFGRRWLAPAMSGEVKGGIALAGIQPGPPQLRATEQAGGSWRITGSSPWVTGWGIVDVVLVAARAGDGDDVVVNLLIDAADAPGLTATRQHLAAVNASRTVRLDFDGVVVDADRVVGQSPYDPGALFSPGLRLNGCLAVGVAARCCALIGPSGLDDDLAALREQLNDCPDEPDAVYAVRADACQFAVRAAAALSVHTGSSAALAGGYADRLTREAQFLLVFGSRPPIKAGLLERFGVR